LRSDTETVLKLAADQKRKIELIVRDERRARLRLVAADKGENAAFIQKAESIRRQYLDKATSLLTEKQSKTWKSLIGAPFDFAER
jgi:hypothetical protein